MGSGGILDFAPALTNVSINNKDYKLIWKLKNGAFLPKSLYNHMAGHSRHSHLGFLANLILKSKASPRISFFDWQAAKELMLTIDNPTKRRIIMVNRYYLCKSNLESTNHLLLWCPVSHSLLSQVFSIMGVHWAIAGMNKGKLLAWEGFCRKDSSHRLIPLTIFWIIWKERNPRAFEGKELDFVSIKDK